MDQKLKRTELIEMEAPPEQPEAEGPNIPEIATEKEDSPSPPLPLSSMPSEAVQPDTRQELTTKYQTNQIKKLLQHIKKKDTNQDIKNLDNLEALIRSTLTNSHKILRNKREFYSFLFDHNSANFCNNRSKINLYYQNKDSLVLCLIAADRKEDAASRMQLPICQSKRRESHLLHLPIKRINSQL